MINISRANQFISPSGDFSLSSLTTLEKSRIVSIMGESNSGRLATWKPGVTFPSLVTLKANRAYLIESTTTQSGSSLSFESYTIGASSDGLHPQNNAINRIFQFLTYRGPANFDLGNLNSSVKSKILRVYAQGATSTGNFRIWTPSASFPSFRFLVPGSCYLIENDEQTFAAYDIGVPSEEVASSSSSSHAADDLALAFVNDFLLPDAGLISYSS